MLIKENSYSIVLVGAWNRAILTPAWLVANLFEDNPQPQVEFSLNLDMPFRFRIKNMIIAPTFNKVTLLSSDNSDGSLQLLELTAIKLCSILKHTPLVALGINFGFIEKTNKDSLFPLFEFSDKNGISDIGWNITQPLIKRSLSKGDYFTNLSISIDENSDFHFDFNFHYNVSDVDQVASFIQDKVIDYKNQSLGIMNSLYNLTIE